MKKIILTLAILVQVTVAFSQHFKVANNGGATAYMNVYITNADIDGVALKAGDEIAVFDGNLCCGVIVLTGEINPLVVTTEFDVRPAADDGGSNGFKNGNKMYFRFWNSIEGKEYTNVIPSFDAGYFNVFQDGETAFVSLSTGNTTKTWTNSNENRVWSQAENWEPEGVPEPFSDVIIPDDVDSPPLIGTTENANCGSLILNNLSAMVLNSSLSGTGSLIVASDITGTGVVTSRRYLVNNGWHLVSSPISGQTIASFLTTNTAIPTKDASRGMMDYNETTDDWGSYFTNTTAGELLMGKGYGVRRNANGYITFTGLLSGGNVNVPVTKDNNGWNLVGNPFSSAMFVKQEVFGFLVENDAMLDASFKAIYVWDAATSAYSVVNMSEGQANLASGQGFFIKAASAGNVTFTKQMQVHQTDAAFKSAKIPWPSIVLNAKANGISSSAKISFNEEMTLGLDPGYDAGILRSGNGFDIYSKLLKDNGVDFMVQALPGRSTDSYVIPIGVDANKGGEIVFSANAHNLPESYDLMIEDKLTNSIANLKNGEMYVADLASDTKGVGRFYLHVGSSVQTGIQEIQQDELSVYTLDQTVYIKGNVSSNAQFMVYSIDGRLMNQFGAKSQNLNQMSIAGYTPGIYFVNIQDKVRHKPVKFVVGK